MVEPPVSKLRDSSSEQLNSSTKSMFTPRRFGAVRRSAASQTATLFSLTKPTRFPTKPTVCLRLDPTVCYNYTVNTGIQFEVVHRASRTAAEYRRKRCQIWTNFTSETELNYQHYTLNTWLLLFFIACSQVLRVAVSMTVWQTSR